jgi:hypothetical protein
MSAISQPPYATGALVHTVAIFITENKIIRIFNTVNCLLFSRDSMAHIPHSDIAPVAMYIRKSLTEWSTIARFTLLVIRLLKLYSFVLSGMQLCVLTSMSQEYCCFTFFLYLHKNSPSLSNPPPRLYLLAELEVLSALDNGPWPSHGAMYRVYPAEIETAAQSQRAALIWKVQ